MPEIISDLPYTIVSTQGVEFYASVAGEVRTNGEWEGWLEFVPLDGSDALVTSTETTQPDRAALLRWADTLTEVYVQGAFARAVAITESPQSRLVARRMSEAAVTAATIDLPDVFKLFQENPQSLRDRLSAWPRTTLLNIISTANLNPAGKSLAWLTDRQLVTFIVTAIEAQLQLGRRPL